MANPKGILTWVNPTTNTDGTAYNQATEGAGYDLALDNDTPIVTLPFAFGTTFDMGALSQYKALKSGAHDVRLRVVTKGGTVSDYAVTPFSVVGTPSAPTALKVA